MEALTALAITWRRYTTISISWSLHGGFALHSQSAPPWRLYNALSISRPFCRGFVLHLLSVGLSVEALYISWPLSGRGGFYTALYIAQPSRGGFVPISRPVEASYITFYRSAPRGGYAALLSIGLCQSFVLYGVAVFFFFI